MAACALELATGPKRSALVPSPRCDLSVTSLPNDREPRLIGLVRFDPGVARGHRAHGALPRGLR